MDVKPVPTYAANPDLVAREGECVSCGVPLPEGYPVRCPVCVVAAYHALGMTPPTEVLERAAAMPK